MEIIMRDKILNNFIISPDKDYIRDFVAATASERESNFIVKESDVAVPEHGPGVIMQTKEVNRPFRSNEQDNSFYVKTIDIVRLDDADQVGLFGRTLLQEKITETVMPYKRKVAKYAPMTDIESNNMFAIIPEEVYEILGYNGVPVDGIRMDYEAIESVPASAWQVNASDEALRMSKMVKDMELDLEHYVSEIVYDLNAFMSQLNESNEAPIEIDLLPYDVTPSEFVEKVENTHYLWEWITTSERLRSMYSNFVSQYQAYKDALERLKAFESEIVSESLAKIEKPKTVDNVQPDIDYILRVSVQDM